MTSPFTGHSADPANIYVEVTLSYEPLENGACRAILCSEDGVLNLWDYSGVERENVPVLKGYNPLRAIAIDEPTTGSAPTTVFALY